MCEDIQGGWLQTAIVPTHQLRPYKPCLQVQECSTRQGAHQNKPGAEQQSPARLQAQKPTPQQERPSERVTWSLEQPKVVFYRWSSLLLTRTSKHCSESMRSCLHANYFVTIISSYMGTKRAGMWDKPSWTSRSRDVKFPWHGKRTEQPGKDL